MTKLDSRNLIKNGQVDIQLPHLNHHMINTTTIQVKLDRLNQHLHNTATTTETIPKFSHMINIRHKISLDINSQVEIMQLLPLTPALLIRIEIKIDHQI